MTADRSKALLLDADGSFYNEIYKALIMRVVFEFGHDIDDFINKYFAGQADSASAVALTQRIIDFINQIDISKLRHPETMLQEQVFISCVARLKASKIIAEDASVSRICASIRNAYIFALDVLSSSIMDLVFIKANENFIRYLIYDIRNNGIGNLILLSGSARQSLRLELINARKNGTRIFCHDLDMLANYLRSSAIRTPLNIIVDPILTEDHAAELPIGESFFRILHSTNAEVDAQHKTTLDTNKGTILWTVSHHLPVTYSDLFVPGKFSADFYDNKKDILKALSAAFRSNSRRVLLSTLPITLIKYNGIKRKPLGVISGTGRVEKNYPGYFNLMVAMCKELLGKPDSRKIDSVHDLDFDLFINLYSSQPTLPKTNLLSYTHSIMYPKRQPESVEQYESECERLRMISCT